MQKKFVPVMITPFNLKAQIDLGMVEALVDFYLEAGVEGFFANCLSSEMYSISEDERLELTQHVVRYVNGRVPVVATGSFGLTINDKAEFTKKIYDTGVDSVIMITGHFANVDEPDDILLKRFDQLFSLTGDIPLGLYECPAPYKRIITPAILKTLLATNRLIYHKDTSCNVEQVKAKLDVVKGSRLEFYDAHTPNAVASMQMGAAGMSSISGNFYPEILVWLCKNVLEEDKQEDVRWIQSELQRVDPLIHIAYPMSAKYFLQQRGFPVRTISRAHALELTPEQKQTLQQIHRDFLGWCERLQIQPVQAAALPSH
ncbi:4-hydroxy-tetrahydrodipicolinate synthase [Chitinophaga terrae (ex Kim and Jung 2007)]|uniref:4-hydroxy-tetrahydrodipicolinate synthase n=1 Tax=Chitinophaga terrae (ex Kim and Jung 2007) TaxID=408074 RepID=A0A1H4AS72_9BACT|nr:dihydrodipicolinate synthase family protein [Chitinophaga terrae (ex Kim and Jung 2007)]GEP89167.1 dihydrodipicolinate synthase family protein [Chitinophaga terrae (ex Kim and Jung 2007)]SEA38743.1 4-hydroxy-tetrahydrodipicolinate synthase [Chitinophaga terrae (ex Kim and Jung 2007)]